MVGAPGAQRHDRTAGAMVVSEFSWDQGTEFGGVGGQVQPPPHQPTSSEILHMIYALDTADGDTPLPAVIEENIE
jgi:hypothetical protein